MPDEPSSTDRRHRRGGIFRPVVAAAPPGPAWEQPAEPVPSRLPLWPFRAAPRGGERPAEAVAPTGRHPDAPSGPRQFTADRAAARYAPEGASFRAGDLDMPVLTVSLSGIAIRWDGGRLPAAGSRIEGEVATGGPGAPFAATFDVVRVEPERRLVAGRFAPLPGAAIDRLLSWLSQLDRAAGRG